MNIAIFGRPNESTTNALCILLKHCKNKGKTLLVHKFLKDSCPENTDYIIFDKTYDFSNVDIAISLGGDGTFIRFSRMIAPYNVPILGVNTGRLGFLADIPVENLIETLDELEQNICCVESRTLLELCSTNNCHKDSNIAINEISILRRDTSSLLVVNIYADDQYINTYWADGLIIATPTGSTAYSMAAGGPIVAPESKNLIITPISPHSLTARPLVLNDDVKLTIEVESRNDSYLVSIDSRSEVVNVNEKLYINKSPYCLKVIKDKKHDYFATLREKLMWGKDKRQ